jgi:hypothetical protein
MSGWTKKFAEVVEAVSHDRDVTIGGGKGFGSGALKVIPMGPYLADMLKKWKRETRYSGPDDWVFASARTHGKRPLGGQSLMRKNIRPVAATIPVKGGSER